MTKLKSNYMLFIFEFADPAKLDKEALTKDLKFPISVLFKKQKHLSDARALLGREKYKDLFALYFDQFKDLSELDMKTLKSEVNDHKHVFLRGIGKDRLDQLTGLVSRMNIYPDHKPRGLLFMEHQ